MSSNLDSLKIEDIDNKRILNIDLEEEEQVFDDAESEKKDEPEVSPEMKKIDEKATSGSSNSREITEENENPATASPVHGMFNELRTTKKCLSNFFPCPNAEGITKKIFPQYIFWGRPRQGEKCCQIGWIGCTALPGKPTCK